MMEKLKIYVLKDPRNNEIRYVGVTSRRLRQRLSCHLWYARQGHKTHCYNWIRTLLKLNLEPIIEEISRVKEYSEEIEWIKHFKDLGCKLTNHSEGGEGYKGKRRKPFTLEHREKISKALLGNKNGSFQSEGARERLAQRNRDRQTGVPKSLDVRGKISNTLKGRKRPPETELKRLLTLLENKKPKPDEINLIHKLSSEGKSRREIQRVTGINRPRIKRILEEEL